MPVYHYTARNQSGGLVRGHIEADNERSVKGKVIGMGYYPVAIRMEGEQKHAASSRIRGRVRTDDLVAFTWQLSAMVGSSLSLVDALSAQEEETDSVVLKQAIGAVRKDIQDGESLSRALSHFPHIFSPLFVSMVRAGEAGGMLDVVLDRLAVHLDREQDLRQRVKSALTYPIAVACLAVAAVIFMLLYVVPVFAKIYKSARVDLPLPTTILMVSSRFVVDYWWVMLILLAAGTFAYWRISLTRSFRPFVDGLKLEMPIFGRLNRKVAISRFVRTMSNMVASGVPMMEALELSGRVTGNQIIYDAVEKIRLGVSEGEGIADPMARTKQFPPLVVHMVSAGEESGNLDEMLAKISDFFDREVEYTLKKITTLLEPLLTVVMGVVVGFIAIAMYLPIFSIAKAIHR